MVADEQQEDKWPSNVNTKLDATGKQQKYYQEDAQTDKIKGSKQEMGKTKLSKLKPEVR